MLRFAKLSIWVCAFTLGIVGVAEAQTTQQLSIVPQITLYEHVNFRGQSITIRAGDDGSNLINYNFNDRVSSFRLSGGIWEVCTDINFGGECQRYNSDAPNVGSRNDLISSVRLLNQRPPTQRPVPRPMRITGETQGANGVGFFAVPRANGNAIDHCEISGTFTCGDSGADAVCRMSGYREAIHYSLVDPRRYGGATHVGDGAQCVTRNCRVIVDLLCTNN